MKKKETKEKKIKIQKEEQNQFADEKRRKSPIDLKKEMSYEEKKELLKKRELEYNMGMAKKYELDKKINDNENKKNISQKKQTQKDKKIIFIITLIILGLFIIATYLSNPGNLDLKKMSEEKKIEKEKSKYKPEEERVKEIKERLNKRKNDFNSFILESDKPQAFPKRFEIDYFINIAVGDKLIIKDIDEIHDNNIFIGNNTIKVEDLSVIFKDKYLRSKQEAEVRELREIDENKPNIIFTRKYGLYTKEGELIVNILDGKPQNFDGFVDKNENPIVIAYDKADGDLTDKMTFTPELKNLKSGQTYTLKYKVSNSKGEVSEREFRIKCVNITGKILK